MYDTKERERERESEREKNFLYAEQYIVLFFFGGGGANTEKRKKRKSRNGLLKWSLSWLHLVSYIFEICFVEGFEWAFISDIPAWVLSCNWHLMRNISLWSIANTGMWREFCSSCLVYIERAFSNIQQFHHWVL